MSYFNPSEINLSAIGEEEYMEEVDEETEEGDTSYSHQPSTSSETPARGRKRKEREMVPEATPQGPKRKNRKLKEEDREVSIPYQILAALFFLNAGGYQTVQPMYTFIRVFFTKCLPQGTTSWEGSIRAYVTTGEWFTGRKCSLAKVNGEGEKKGRELKEWAFKNECKQAFMNHLERWMRDNGRVKGFQRGMTYPDTFDEIVSGNYRQPTQDEIDAWGVEHTRLGRKSPEEIRKAQLQHQERERYRAIQSIAPSPYQGDYNAPAFSPAPPQMIAYRVVQNAPGSSRQSQGSYHQVQQPQQPYIHHCQQPMMGMPNPHHINGPVPQQYQQEAFHQQMPVQDHRVVFQQRPVAEEMVQMDNRHQERMIPSKPMRQPQQPAPTPPHRTLSMSKATPSAPRLPLATQTRYTLENVLAARSEDKLSKTLRATRNVLDHAMDNARKQDYKMIIRRKQKTSVPDKEIAHQNAAENANEAVTPGEEEAGAAEMGNLSNKVTHNQDLPDEFLDGK